MRGRGGSSRGRTRQGWVSELDSLSSCPVVWWLCLLWGLQSRHEPWHVSVILPPWMCSNTLVGLMILPSDLGHRLQSFQS